MFCGFLNYLSGSYILKSLEHVSHLYELAICFFYFVAVICTLNSESFGRTDRYTDFVDNFIVVAAGAAIAVAASAVFVVALAVDIWDLIITVIICILYSNKDDWNIWTDSQIYALRIYI